MPQAFELMIAFVAAISGLVLSRNHRMSKEAKF